MHCQNQPYCYFVESSFRQRLEEGTFPNYLLFSFLAVAIRFSHHPFFENSHDEATECYARLAWADIYKQSFSEDHNVNLSTVQAANILAVVDFVRGRHKLAWVKIGLSVRFAQSLHLNTEPEDHYSSIEREERRRTFWSVYLLDKLVSPGRHRPPTLLDEDCFLRLPSNDRATTSAPTLALLNEIPDVAPLEKDDHFAKTIFMASVLGRVVRFGFQQTSGGSCVPWDSRSEYAHIHGILLSFETYSDAADSSFATALDRDFTSNDLVDFPLSGHFCFSHALYHLNHCLLHHPFLLRQRLKRHRSIKVPPSFLREAIQRSDDHATHLVTMLQALQARGYVAYPSFYGYCAMVAGVIHRLHTANENAVGQTVAAELFDACINFLGANAGPWDHYRRMSVALQNFCPTPSAATELLSYSLNQDHTAAEDIERLWNLIDYGWLSDSARPTTSRTSSTVSKPGSDSWNPFLQPMTSGSNDYPLSFENDDMLREENIEQSLFEAINGNRVHSDIGSVPTLPTEQWLTALGAR